jgi:hypothetical protein
MAVNFGQKAEMVFGLLSLGNLLRNRGHRSLCDARIATIGVSVLLRFAHGVNTLANFDGPFASELILNYPKKKEINWDRRLRVVIVIFFQTI